VILHGAQWVGFGVGALIIATCLAPALWVRERPLPQPAGRLRGTRAFLSTLRNRAFLHMLGMNFFAIVGMYAPVTATLVLNIYFLFDGNQDAAATLTGYAGMAQLIGSLAGVPVNTWLSVRFGKRTTALASLALAGAGFLSLWFTLQPVAPYWYVLSAFVIGWGTQGVWLMSATMNADVCDSDELDTGERREGLYGAVFALEQKLALACAALLGGYVASLCGYDAGTAPDAQVLELLRRCVVAIPLIGVGAAAFFCFSYPLSHARLLTVQAKLRERSP
jgi:Na+/melibiose symporter-like transporter